MHRSIIPAVCLASLFSGCAGPTQQPVSTAATQQTDDIIAAVETSPLVKKFKEWNQKAELVGYEPTDALERLYCDYNFCLVETAAKLHVAGLRDAHDIMTVAKERNSRRRNLFMDALAAANYPPNDISLAIAYLHISIEHGTVAKALKEFP